MPRQIDIIYSRAKNNYYTDIQTTNILIWVLIHLLTFISIPCTPQ